MKDILKVILTKFWGKEQPDTLNATANTSNTSSGTTNTSDATQVIQKLYIKQRRRRKPHFRGKSKEIEHQYAKFWQHPSAKKDVVAFRDRTPNYRFPRRDKWLKEHTVFSNPPADSILTESTDCWIVGNHASFDVAQYVDKPGTASMSFIHLLGVPKARLYNGVSLNPDDVFILGRIYQLFEESWRDNQFRQRVLQYQEEAIEQRFRSIKNPNKVDKEGYEQALTHFNHLRDRVLLNEGDFAFALHLYPDHSIPYLHVHIIEMSEEMRQYSTTEHDKKTKDANEVRDFISNAGSNNGGFSTCIRYGLWVLFLRVFS